MATNLTEDPPYTFNIEVRKKDPNSQPSPWEIISMPADWAKQQPHPRFVNEVLGSRQQAKSFSFLEAIFKMHVPKRMPVRCGKSEKEPCALRCEEGSEVCRLLPLVDLQDATHRPAKYLFDALTSLDTARQKLRESQNDAFRLAAENRLKTEDLRLAEKDRDLARQQRDDALRQLDEARATLRETNARVNTILLNQALQVLD